MGTRVRVRFLHVSSAAWPCGYSRLEKLVILGRTFDNIN